MADQPERDPKAPAAPGRGAQSLTARVAQNRLFVLLCVLIAFIVFSPIAHLTGLGQGSLTIAFLVVFAAAINASRDPGGWTLIAFAVGVPTLLLWLARLTLDHPYVDIAGDVFGIGVLIFTIVVVLRHILMDRATSFDTLCGAAAVYLLFALAWANSYELIAALNPGAFEDLSAESSERWNQLVYFSLTTLTTLGYGDIKAIGPFARVWSSLEAATGVLYIAILVARLVALYRREH